MLHSCVIPDFDHARDVELSPSPASAANQGEEDPVDDLDQGRVGNRLLGHDHIMADEVHR